MEVLLISWHIYFSIFLHDFISFFEVVIVTRQNTERITIVIEVKFWNMCLIGIFDIFDKRIQILLLFRFEDNWLLENQATSLTVGH